jgi:salicylate hydroxylase
MMINIVGAGLGGLALAQGLRRRGIAYRIFERDADASDRQQGYRISLNPLGRTALAELLPPERFRDVLALECRDVGRGFAFARGPSRPLLRMPDADAWTVCRPALRRLLLQDVDVTWNARIDQLADLPAANLTVAADGVGSRLRDELHADGLLSLVDTGVRTRAALLPRTDAWNGQLPLNREGAVQYLGPRGQALFVSYCETDARRPMILWALSQKSSEPPVPDKGWDPTLMQLMREGEITIDRLAIRSMRVKVPKRGTRLHPQLTLLGDAAHAMPPQRGLGGNNAFEDARQLIAHLDDVAAYEREMLTRGKKAIAESEEALQLLCFANPVARVLRDNSLRVASWMS